MQRNCIIYLAHSTGACVAEIVISTKFSTLQSFMRGIDAFDDFALGAFIRGESPVYSLDYLGTYLHKLTTQINKTQIKEQQ